MPGQVAISEAEATVMQVLWERSPRSAEEVFAAVAKDNDWAEATVKTLLNRLLNKGAVVAEREGRRYLYSARLSREAWVNQQSEGLLQRVFGGRVAPLVAHFSEQGRLSAQDIRELRRLLREIDDGT